jgi:hypothetical protein
MSFVVQCSLTASAVAARIPKARVPPIFRYTIPIPRSAETKLNRIWCDIEWGRVRLEEKRGYLSIEHHSRHCGSRLARMRWHGLHC